MRILKYLFLLLLLSMVALTIFIATQKGDFSVKRSKIINSTKATVYNYVNDSKNWEEWNSLALDDAGIKVTYSQNTIGKGSSYSWEGKNGYGDFQTLYTKENDSIVQKMNFNGNTADVFWSFKDTLGGTKVTWITKGKMDFTYKVLTVLNGGAKGIIGMMFEKSLVNIDKKLDYEINTYSVKVNGLVNIPESYYLAQTFTSEISKVGKNSGIVFPKIINFCKKNNITISGNPFIIYHTYDSIKQLTKLSICIPIKDSIFFSEGSDISSVKTTPYQAVKTTLTGDYSHKNKALIKTNEFINLNYLSLNPLFSHLEIYKISKNENKSPSKWVTEIYIPVKPKVVYKKPLVEESKNEVIAQPTKIEKEIPSEF
ncbi:MAG: transcriptional regulator [Flavobacterium sp.]|uniref:SRPBCC family protein n=1 Tax=Flavobacterium sp. TaxID=239 RepID=UPI00263074EA|nr:transcriptional regulator [Flavobacterium sp.]MDD5149194.1 transcriptional regulator [Flavobacterium sp.]